MKLDRVIWGILLLFVGGVLLLDNFEIIEFYWRNIWSFWPVFLIILGVNILFNKNNSQTGNIITLGILVITLSFLFVKGQERPEHGFWWDKDVDVYVDKKWDSVREHNKFNYSEPFLSSDTDKKTILNIRGGSSTYELKGVTDSLITANVSQIRKGMKFMLSKTTTDSVNTIDFKSNSRKNSAYFGNDDNSVDFYLNTLPVWEMNLFMGAGKVDFDVSKYKVRTFNFDGGAASIEVKIGDLLPITDVNVQVGMAEIKIEVPKSSGCRINTKTGLSSKDFDGFIKIKDGVYESPNYQGSTKKVFINLDGGLSDFEVKRY